MKKLISEITYSNKAAKKKEYEKFGKRRKTKNIVEKTAFEKANATKEQDSNGLYP